MSALTLSTESPATRPHQTGLHVALVQLQRARTRAGRTRSAIIESAASRTSQAGRYNVRTCVRDRRRARLSPASTGRSRIAQSWTPKLRRASSAGFGGKPDQDPEVRLSPDVSLVRRRRTLNPWLSDIREGAPLPQPHRFSRAARSVTRRPCEPGRLTGRRSDGAGRRPARRLGTRDAAP